MAQETAALVGCFLTGDQPEDRGLAGAVRADQAGPVTGQDLEAGVPKQDAVAMLAGDIDEMNHESLKKIIP